MVYHAYLCLIATYTWFLHPSVFSKSFCHLLICIYVLCNLCVCIHVCACAHICMLSKISSSIAPLFFAMGAGRTSILPMNPSLQAASGAPFLGRQDCKEGCTHTFQGEHMLQGSHTAAGERSGGWLPYALVISIVQPWHSLCQNSTVSLGCLAAGIPRPSINVCAAGPHISDLSSVSTQFPIVYCFPNTPTQ